MCTAAPWHMVMVFEIISIFCRLRCHSFPALSIGKESSYPPQSILQSQFGIQVFGLSSNSFRPSTRPSGADSYPQCRRESETLISVELFLIYASASKFRLSVCTPSVAVGQISSIQFMHATKY